MPEQITPKSTKIMGKRVLFIEEDNGFWIFVHYRFHWRPKHPMATITQPHPKREHTVCDYIRIKKR